MAQSGLPPDWAAWLKEAVGLGCASDELLDRLAAGGFPRALSRRALHDAICERDGRPAGPMPPSRPTPRTQPHLMLVGGQAVRVACMLDRPQVVLYEGLLSDVECDAMLALAQGQFERSTVVDSDSATGGEWGARRVDAQRSSSGASFQRAQTPLLDRLEQRIATLVDWPVSHGEGFQVLQYDQGAEYRAHLDTFDPARPGSAAFLRRGGQRVGTLVIFLAEPEAGGGTRFAKAGLEVCPQRGAGVYFASVDEDGEVDPLSLHAGMPVLQGVKCVATKWLRQHPY